MIKSQLGLSMYVRSGREIKQYQLPAYDKSASAEGTSRFSAKDELQLDRSMYIQLNCHRISSSSSLQRYIGLSK